MIMRNYLKKTYMGIASLLALMSCSDGNDIHTYTVGAEDNAIALSIGVDNSPLTPTPNLAKTRAAEVDNYLDSRHQDEAKSGGKMGQQFTYQVHRLFCRCCNRLQYI